MQEAAEKIEHLLEKYSLTANEMRDLVNLFFFRLLGHTFTVSQILVREEGLCHFTGRADLSLYSQEAEPDSLEAAYISPCTMSHTEAVSFKV